MFLFWKVWDYRITQEREDATKVANNHVCVPLPLPPLAPPAGQDRLETLRAVREAGISVCAGGIIGLGEGEQDRVGLLHTLATLPEHPESVPINMLVAVKGTPMQVRGNLLPLTYSLTWGGTKGTAMQVRSNLMPLTHSPT